MRRYQQKQANRVRELYHSNDPLRWVRMASLLGINKPLTDRERRIFVRRFSKGMRQLGKTINEALTLVVTETTKAARGLVAFFEQVKQNPQQYDLNIRQPLPLTVPDLPIESMTANRMALAAGLKLQLPDHSKIIGVKGDV